ncbi:acyl carrier protein [Kutzneria chonburiensis]|uniref:Acyl carrier protein n=1 Tax=Kutzneria chonburiensis TaxID=1483604 RepID=A0ABV6MKQ7_9PSEU|nr:acyl carrier protein [Kutzneria chonburiensis]
MVDITLEDLVEIMRKCAGEDENLIANDAVATTDFDELGYDSLALMAASAEVEKSYGVAVDEGELAEIRNLASFVELVNKKLALRAPAS